VREPTAVAGPFLEKLADVVAAEGIITEYGWLQPGTPILPLVPALLKGISERGFHLSYHLIALEDRIATLEAQLRAVKPSKTLPENR
jgi:hypothetical protein